MNFNSRFRLPPKEIQEKLRLSQQEAETIETRFLYCPFCGIKLQKIPVSQTTVVFVKCRKCKFEGALNPAYFRRKRRYSKNQISYSRTRKR